MLLVQFPVSLKVSPMNNGKPPAAALPTGITPTILTNIANTTDGYALVTLALPPYHLGLPSHQHPAHAEGCYVIQGTLAVTHDSKTITLHQGASILIPPGATHTYWNPTAAPTTVLLIYQPGGEIEDITALAACSDL
jgi:quercetin dioxygenase-like cupin family protein